MTRKIKRSGRTIIAATSGLLIYTLFFAWYDGFGANSEKIDPHQLSKLSPGLQAQLMQHVARDNKALFFVCLNEFESQPVYTLAEACHPDWLVKWQLKTSMENGFPNQSYEVIRYQTPGLFVQAISESYIGSGTQENYTGRILSTDDFWLNTKLMIAIFLTLPILSIIYRVGKT